MTQEIEIEDFGTYTDQISNDFLAGSFEPAIQDCEEHLQAQVTKQFESCTNPDGEAWVPWYWSEDPENHPAETLFASGRLRDSFMHDSADHVEEIGGRDLVWGTSVEYAAIHDQGARIVTGVDLYGRAGGYLPKGSIIEIPQRQIVGWAEDTVEQCEASIVEYVSSEIF